MNSKSFSNSTPTSRTEVLRRLLEATVEALLQAEHEAHRKLSAEVSPEAVGSELLLVDSPLGALELELPVFDESFQSTIIDLETSSVPYPYEPIISLALFRSDQEQWIENLKQLYPEGLSLPFMSKAIEAIEEKTSHWKNEISKDASLMHSMQQIHLGPDAPLPEASPSIQEQTDCPQWKGTQGGSLWAQFSASVMSICLLAILGVATAPPASSSQLLDQKLYAELDDRQLLEELLQQSAEREDLRHIIEVAAKRSDRHITQALIALSAHQDFVIRAEVTKALGAPQHFRADDAYETVAALLNDQDYVVRGFAAKVLGQAGSELARITLLERLSKEQNKVVVDVLHSSLSEGSYD